MPSAPKRLIAWVWRAICVLGVACSADAKTSIASTESFHDVSNESIERKEKLKASSNRRLGCSWQLLVLHGITGRWTAVKVRWRRVCFAGASGIRLQLSCKLFDATRIPSLGRDSVQEGTPSGSAAPSSRTARPCTASVNASKLAPGFRLCTGTCTMTRSMASGRLPGCHWS